MKTAAEHEISKALPAEARRRLIEAAKVSPEAPPGCSFERMRAVDSAVAWCRNTYPNFFQPQY